MKLLQLLQLFHLLFPDGHFLVRHVSLCVLGEVVTSHELAGTDGTLVLLLSRMSPFVASKLIRAGEPSLTILPVAHIRLLPCVSPHMSLEVRALVVGFATTRVLAYKWLWSVLLFSGCQPGVFCLSQDGHHWHQLILDELGDDGLVCLG